MQRRTSQLAIAFSPTFKRQTTWDTPLDPSELTASFPATSRNWITTDETVEDVFDCTGEDFLIERVTGRFSRLTIDFDVDPQLLTGWLAFAYGVAAAPSGGVNEIQRLTGAGIVAGTWQGRFTNDYNMQLSAALAAAATAANIQTALRAMSNIGSPNASTAGGPIGTAPVDITFSGPLGNQPLARLQILSALTGGGSIAVTTPTPGVGRTHLISRLGVGSYTLPFTTFYIGFRGSDRDPLILMNAVVDSIRCRGNSRGTVTATVTIVFSAPDETEASDIATGFIMPDCLDIEPARFGDCDFLVEGESLFVDNGARWGNGSGLPLWQSFEYGFDNGVVARFDRQGVDVTRLERANRRPSYINFGILGERGDPLYVAAANHSPRYVTSGALRVGPVSNNCLINVPQGILKLDDPAITFDSPGGGEPESIIRAIMRPKKIHGNSNTPSNVTATVEQDVAYLIAA